MLQHPPHLHRTADRRSHAAHQQRRKRIELVRLRIGQWSSCQSAFEISPKDFRSVRQLGIGCQVGRSLAQFLIWIPSWLLSAFAWFGFFVSIQHLFHQQTPERELSFGTGIIAFSALFGTMPLGFMLTNLVLWRVPPLGRANELSGKDVPGMSFKDATEDLILIAKILMPVCAVAGFVGAWEPWH